MNARIARDKNGNKIVKLSFPSFYGKSAKGFSIQTNQNLPITHRTNIPNVNEIMGYVKIYGTLRQKKIMGLDTLS